MPERLADKARRIEVRAVLAWMVLAGAVWAFLALAGEVGEGETSALDLKLLLLLRVPGHTGTAIGPAWLGETMRDLTALGGFTLLTLIVVCAATALLLARKFRFAAVLVGTCAAAQVSGNLLKVLYNRARPDISLHAVPVYTLSFPSGHATMAAATYFTLAVVAARLESSRQLKVGAFAIAGFVTVAVGVSRVYLGVHWPTDVLGGWIAGGGWALLAALLLPKNGGTRSS